MCREDEIVIDTGRGLEILRNVAHDVEHEMGIDVDRGHRSWRTDDVGCEEERNGDRDDASWKDVDRGRASRAEVGRASVW